MGWKIPCKRAWQPTPVFLPGKSHGQRSLVGYSPWDHKELDRTEHIHAKYINKEKELTIVLEGPTVCLHAKAYSMLPKY